MKFIYLFLVVLFSLSVLGQNKPTTKPKTGKNTTKVKSKTPINKKKTTNPKIIKKKQTIKKTATGKDFKIIKTPKVKLVKPDTSALFTDEFKELEIPDDDNLIPSLIDEAEAEEYNFDGLKLPSLLNEEDTSTVDENDGNGIVEVEEQIKIDSVWIKIAGYYDNWNPKNINPYKVDGTNLQPVDLQLIDSANGRFWSNPLNHCLITSNFGFRRVRWHYGIDLDLDIGDSVLSVFDGIIRMTGWDGGGYGNFVVVRHYNGLETLYGHLKRYIVKSGQLVKAGQMVGFGGSTGRSSGPHLHWEIRYAGNPIDPMFFWDFKTCALRLYKATISKENFQYLINKGSGKYPRTRKGYYHTVRSGENLSKIARRYGTSVSRLCKLNGITSRTNLKIGRRLRLR